VCAVRILTLANCCVAHPFIPYSTGDRADQAEGTNCHLLIAILFICRTDTDEKLTIMVDRNIVTA
jgi:hypothetical protein